MSENSYGSVKLWQVKKAIKSIEEHNYGRPINTDDIDISFEYLVGSFFPDILKNIEKAMLNEFERGFRAGKGWDDDTEVSEG